VECNTCGMENAANVHLPASECTPCAAPLEHHSFKRPCGACIVGDRHGHSCSAFDPTVDREHREHAQAYTWRDFVDQPSTEAYWADGDERADEEDDAHEESRFQANYWAGRP
jgi:hypothetical protein